MFLSTKPLIFLSEICFQLEVAIRVIWPLSNWTVKEPEGWTLGGLARYPSEGRRTSGGLATYPSEGHRAGPQGRWPKSRSGSFHHWLMAYLRLWVEEVRDVTGGLAGTHSLTNTAGRAAGPHVTAFPLERTLLSDKDPPPSSHSSVVPQPRARPHPSRFHATHSHPYLLILYRPSPEGSPRTADTGALERGAWLGTTPGTFFCISWILTA